MDYIGSSRELVYAIIALVRVLIREAGIHGINIEAAGRWLVVICWVFISY